MYQRVLDCAANFNHTLVDKRVCLKSEDFTAQLFTTKRKKLTACKFLEVDYVLGPRVVEAMNKPKLLDPAYRESQDSEIMKERKEAEVKAAAKQAELEAQRL